MGRVVRAVAGRGAGVLGRAGTLTESNCCDWDWVRSNTDKVPWGTPPTTPVPTMLTSARPSAPTATPCGLDGRRTVWLTERFDRSMTLIEALPLLVTYSHALSIDMAAASGVVPTLMLLIIWPRL